jgi:hypothetical protein
MLALPIPIVGADLVRLRQLHKCLVVFRRCVEFRHGAILAMPTNDRNRPLDGCRHL